MPTSHYRLFGAYRFFLAGMVLVSHTLWISGQSTFLGEVGLGNIAVMSFFILSGFIISEAGSTFYRDRPVAFLINRFWRIAPAYWLAVALSVAVHFILSRNGTLVFPDYPVPPKGIFEAKNIVSNFFTIFPLQGRLGLVHPDNFYGFVRFYWAILVEVEFYGIAFIALCMMKVLHKQRSVVLAAFIVAFLLLHIVNDYFIFLYRELSLAPYFLLGVCIFGACSGIRFSWPAAALNYVLVVLHFARYAQNKISLSAMLSTTPEPAVLFAVIWLAAMPPAIYAMCRIRVQTPTRRIDRRLGDLSYPLYLNHYVVIILAVSVGLAQTWLTFLIICIGSICLSWAASAVVEIPLKPLRDSIRGETL